MSLIQRQLKQRQQPAKDEQGMALAIAMMMGLMLTVASSGLLSKQLMLRRLGAAESHKQMAEMAATSGMNRLLASMNAVDTSEGGVDLTYLWELNQNASFSNGDPNQQQWDLPVADIRPKLNQPCYPMQEPRSAELGLFEGELANGANLRDDGRPNAVQANYRLRSYRHGGTNGTFEIEGYTTHSGGNQVLSRSLLTRTLSVEEAVASNQHWGALAAETMQLGPSSINGDGLALWLIDEATAQAEFGNSASCTSVLAEATGSSDESMQADLWPRSSDDSQFPSLELFADHNVHPEQLDIDTSRAQPNVVVGNGQSKQLSGLFDNNRAPRQITLRSDYLCQGKTDKPCLVKIQNLKLTNGVSLSIETGDKPVILRLVNASSQMDLSGGSLCQAESSTASNRTLPCSNQAKAERLVIAAPEGTASGSCSTSRANLTLQGNSLPAAVVLMPNGSTRLSGPATMNGLLWSSSLCAQPGLTLSSNNADGSSVISGFRQLWADSSFQFGRTAWRGVRGSTHDLFRRW
jgi:hypothetical protein